jgi:hypothetical protein
LERERGVERPDRMSGKRGIMVVGGAEPQKAEERAGKRGIRVELDV